LNHSNTSSENEANKKENRKKNAKKRFSSDDEFDFNAALASKVSLIN